MDISLSEARERGLELLGHLYQHVHQKVDDFAKTNELGEINFGEAAREVAVDLSKEFVNQINYRLVPKAKLSDEELAEALSTTNRELPSYATDSDGFLEENKVTELIKLMFNLLAKQEDPATLIAKFCVRSETSSSVDIDRAKMLHPQQKLQEGLGFGEEVEVVSSVNLQMQLPFCFPFSSSASINKILSSIEQKGDNLNAICLDMEMSSFEEFFGKPVEAKKYEEKATLNLPPEVLEMFEGTIPELNGLEQHVQEQMQEQGKLQMESPDSTTSPVELTMGLIDAALEGKITINQAAKAVCILDKLVTKYLVRFESQQDEWLASYWQANPLKTEE